MRELGYRHCERSEAIHFVAERKNGLLVAALLAMTISTRAPTFSRRDAPEFCMNLPPWRAWGMPGVQYTRSLVWEKINHTSVAPQVHRRNPAFPHAMALRLTSRSPRRIGLCCLRRLRIAGSSAPGRADLPSADLTPTTEASGPHDFTVRISIVRPAHRCPLTENCPANTLHARRCRVHRIPSQRS
jgi:hypothetical protein